MKIRAYTASARMMGHLFWEDLFCLLISLQRAARNQLSFSPGSACAAKRALSLSSLTQSRTGNSLVITSPGSHSSR